MSNDAAWKDDQAVNVWVDDLARVPIPVHVLGLMALVTVSEWQAFSAGLRRVCRAGVDPFQRRSPPRPGRVQVDAAILAYERSVVGDEIPHLATHVGPAATTKRALEHLFATAGRVAPTVQNQAFYDSTVRSMNDVAVAGGHRGHAHADRCAQHWTRPHAEPPLRRRRQGQLGYLA